MKLDHELPLNTLELTDLPRQEHSLTNLELSQELLSDTDLQLLAEDKEDLLEADLLDEGEKKELPLLNDLDLNQELLSDELLLNP